MFHSLTYLTKEFIPNKEQRSDSVIAKARERRKEELKIQEQKSYEDYMFEMKEAIARDIGQMQSYFPDELTNKMSPMFTPTNEIASPVSTSHE